MKNNIMTHDVPKGAPLISLQFLCTRPCGSLLTPSGGTTAKGGLIAPRTSLDWTSSEGSAHSTLPDTGLHILTFSKLSV